MDKCHFTTGILGLIQIIAASFLCYFSFSIQARLDPWFYCLSLITAKFFTDHIRPALVQVNCLFIWFVVHCLGPYTHGAFGNVYCRSQSMGGLIKNSRVIQFKRPSAGGHNVSNTLHHNGSATLGCQVTASCHQWSPWIGLSGSIATMLTPILSAAK